MSRESVGLAGNCQVWLWVPAILVVTSKSASLSCNDWEQLPVVLMVKVDLPVISFLLGEAG